MQNVSDLAKDFLTTDHDMCDLANRTILLDRFTKTDSGASKKIRRASDAERNVSHLCMPTRNLAGAKDTLQRCLVEYVGQVQEYSLIVPF